MNRPFYFRRPRRARGGFTLMEMLLVLTIIALLMGMVIYHLTGIGETAKEQRVAADLLGFKESLAAYELETGTLPTTAQGLKALWTRPTVDPIPLHWRAQMDSETLDPWNHSYQYRNPGKRNPDRYDVFSMGPDGLPDTDDDIGNWQSAPATAQTQ
jgi:general secretion pathway protein G